MRAENEAEVDAFALASEFMSSCLTLLLGSFLADSVLGRGKLQAAGRATLRRLMQPHRMRGKTYFDCSMNTESRPRKLQATTEREKSTKEKKARKRGAAALHPLKFPHGGRDRGRWTFEKHRQTQTG